MKKFRIPCRRCRKFLPGWPAILPGCGDFFPDHKKTPPNLDGVEPKIKSYVWEAINVFP